MSWNLRATSAADFRDRGLADNCQYWTSSQHAVVCADRAVDEPTVVEPRVNVLQEIRRGDRRASDVDGEIDIAESRLDPDENLAWGVSEC